MAKGKYIAFLDADDIWLSQKLEIQITYMEEHPEVMWSGTNAVFVDRYLNNEIRCQVPMADQSPFVWRTIEDWFNESIKSHITSTPTVMIRRELINIVGGFDPQIYMGQDMDFWIRIALKYPQYGFCKKPLARILYHLPGSVSLAGQKKYESMLLYLEKHVGAISRDGRSKTSYVEYIRYRTKVFILRCISLGYPDVALKALHLIPDEWMTPSMAAAKFLCRLPAGLLLQLGKIRRMLLNRQEAA
jgi:glycosyltransferase involved in cell wall biosynthesis